MKFRYKVILINLLLLSLTTGIVGFLLMQRSVKLTMDTEIKSAITENNLVQSSVEYSLLDVVNTSGYNLSESLPEIGRAVFSGMLSGEEALLIRYGGKYIYVSDGAEKVVDPEGAAGQNISTENKEQEVKDPLEELYVFPENNHKNYLLRDEEGSLFLYVATDSRVDGKALNIVTRRDISEQKKLIDQSIRDYQWITLVLLAIATLILLILSRLLTRPLEDLSKTTDAFANGDYSTRSGIHTGDEVGHLANRFNSMADSVEEHVDELNDMIHRREQFVADFTHEIKTPMTSIIGYSDTLRSMDLSREEQETALSYIFSEGKRLESMSMKLFDLLYLKDHPIDSKPFAAEVMASQVATSMGPLMKSSDVELKVDVTPAVLEGDIELLKTVFINLIDNARKASKAGSEVEFLGEKDEGSSAYIFTVRDHGIGISEEYQKKIFDEFYMVDKSRTRAAGGAGLGMSLVAVILERHEAHIDLKSAPGKGTEITVTLPGSRSEE